MEEKIDLVYLWVDGSDKNWLEKKNKFFKENNIKTKNEDTNECRFIDNDELKYSLRSVEKYASWINKIYIVTDNQVPNWLDTNNPKIKIVDHKDIMPENALPCFNSIALETQICNIDGLSEHFLYANDDMFLNDYVYPETFFNKEEYPIFRVGKPVFKKDNLHHIAIINAQNLIKDKFNYSITNGMHHNIDAYCKSDIIACNKIFEKEINKTTFSNLRNEKNISRLLYLYYSLAIGHGEKRVVQKIDSTLPLYKKIFYFLAKKYSKESVLINPNDKNNFKKLEKFNSKMFCINDNEEVTNKDRKYLKQFLKEKFNNESSFEEEDNV
ncbi:MAG: stealth family protein [bacterium]|nr:stealth family protein [bacterium]